MSEIAFANSNSENTNDSKRYLKVYEYERDKEMEERIVRKVLSHLALSVDVKRAIENIKELQDELDRFEEHFN